MFNRAVTVARGVNNNDFKVRVRLRHQAGQSIGQAWPVHASDDDADQWELLWRASESMKLAQLRPVWSGLRNALLTQSMDTDLVKRLCRRTVCP